jgi:hypothetical protein
VGVLGEVVGLDIRGEVVEALEFAKAGAVEVDAVVGYERTRNLLITYAI